MWNLPVAFWLKSVKSRTENYWWRYYKIWSGNFDKFINFRGRIGFYIRVMGRIKVVKNLASVMENCIEFK